MTRTACVLSILERVTPELLMGGEKVMSTHTTNALVPTLLSLLDSTQTFVPTIVLCTLEILFVVDGGAHAEAFAQTDSLLLLVRHFNAQSPPQLAALVMRLLDSKLKPLMHPSNISAVCSVCVQLMRGTFPEMHCACNTLDRVMYFHRFNEEVLRVALQTPGVVQATVMVLSQQSPDSPPQFQRPLKLLATMVRLAKEPAQQLELAAGHGLLLTLMHLVYEHKKSHLTNEVCVMLRSIAQWAENSPFDIVEAFLHSGAVLLLVHCVRVVELKDPVHNVLLCEILLILILNAPVQQLASLVRCGVVLTVVALLREHATLSEGLMVLTLQCVNRLLFPQIAEGRSAENSQHLVDEASHHAQLIGKCGGWKFIKVLTTSDVESVKQLACQTCGIN